MTFKDIVLKHNENPEYRKGIKFIEKHFCLVLIHAEKVLRSSWIRKDNFILVNLDFTELSCTEISGTSMMNFLTINEIKNVRSFERDYILEQLPEEFL